MSISPRPPASFEFDIIDAYLMKYPYGYELWCEISEEPEEGDIFYFTLGEVEDMGIDINDIIKHPKRYKVVGQYESWAEIVKK